MAHFPPNGFPLEAPRHVGRPSEYNLDIAEEICRLLAENGSIRKTATEVGVDRATISNWASEHADFSAAIARAKQDGYDNRAELAVENALKAADAAKGRLAFDAERWYLSKIDAKRYGDKLDVTSSDGSMSPPKSLAEFYAKPE